VPNAEYYSRIQQLEDEVKRAEQAVEDAERAYRRGVD
jgi:outer membrane protein TolC